MTEVACTGSACAASASAGGPTRCFALQQGCESQSATHLLARTSAGRSAAAPLRACVCGLGERCVSLYLRSARLRAIAGCAARKRNAREMSRRSAGAKAPSFEPDEAVLCLSRGSYYDAKIIRLQPRDDEAPLYRVHYLGWSSKYAHPPRAVRCARCGPGTRQDA